MFAYICFSNARRHLKESLSLPADLLLTVRTVDISDSNFRRFCIRAGGSRSPSGRGTRLARSQDMYGINFLTASNVTRKIRMIRNTENVQLRIIASKLEEGCSLPANPIPVSSSNERECVSGRGKGEGGGGEVACYLDRNIFCEARTWD